MKTIQIKLQTLLLLLGVSVFLTGCHTTNIYEPRHEGYGPPPHAPAHGYRAKYHGHDLMYDAGLGVYIVVGLPHIYFHDGLYYRFDHDEWYYSDRPDHGWKKSGKSKIPPGLAKKGYKKK